MAIVAGARLLEGRFVVGRRLGEGGMGVVYEAFDDHTKTSVALKTLSRAEPAAVYRLKKEFRALADVVHEHLIGLHELFVEGDDWFFTMELVKFLRLTFYGRELACSPLVT